MNAHKRHLREWLLPILVLASACSSPPRERPSLVVYVVVDQLRADLLDRYDSLFTGGFRRLRDEGFRFTQATHDHASTETAVGHATLSTGVFPSRNGIVANEWLERGPGGWHSVYSVEDTLTHILGLPVLEGRSSRNLLRDGLADWIVASSPRSVVVSASRKDRPAIVMAGKTRGNVYWIPEGEARFVTSGFYGDRYPAWVERFNREEMPRIFGDSIWHQMVRAAVRPTTRRDTVEYEGDGVHTHFPHRFVDEVMRLDRRGALNRWAYAQPFPDDAVAGLAMEAIHALCLGEDDAPDYLALSFSQTDAVGHAYGPLSREQLDNLLRVDQHLGRLMDTLDAEVGRGRWVMALTADHGVLTTPEYLVEQGQKAGRTSRDQLASLRSLFASYREEDGDPLETADALVLALEEFPFVADALTIPELTSGPPADSFVVLMRNSYHPDRWIGGYGSEDSDVVFRFGENLYPSTSSRGTGHGSPYYYDRHVPLIFLGSGVEAGVSDAPVRTVDVAPTLARLAGIPVPDDLDGRPLLK